MRSTLPLALVSAIAFLLLWFAYETKPQKETLWLMGGALVVFLIAVAAVGRETRKP